MNVSVSNLSYYRKTSSGFTLVELMVTVVILGIIVSIAAPNISTQLANQRVKSTTATLTNALKEAKVESVIRRKSITVSYDNNGAESGIINIKVEVPGPSLGPAQALYFSKPPVKDEPEPEPETEPEPSPPIIPAPILTPNFGIIATYQYDAKSRIQPTPATITFKADKRVDAAATYTICDSNTSSSPRQVTINATGLISSKLGGTCK